MSSSLQTITEQLRGRRVDQARTGLEQVPETDENRAELAFLNGFLEQVSHHPDDALEHFNRALDLDPNHAAAAFHAAVVCEQWGDTYSAMSLYRRCTAREQSSVHALLNLAILYEEAERLPEAEACLQSVFEAFPNHVRARQLLKSVQSSRNMMYDEKRRREEDQRDAVLDTSIGEFELSVRSRNCLRQMNILTLGDLLRTTEAELLSYKNFGETSLCEIKAMLSQKSLELGQEFQPAPPTTVPEAPPTGDTSAAMQIPIANIELSVRSRKCLQRLDITTLGELTFRSEPELKATKNFGETSLNEIKRQMTAYGLAFRATL